MNYKSTVRDNQIKTKHPVFRFVRFCVWLFCPKFEVVGQENLPEGPAIVAGNHSQMFGPVSAELYFPGKHSTWCISDMMEKDKVAEYAYQDFWSKKPAFARPFFKLLSLLIPSLSQVIFTNADTIPVYRDRRIMKTFQLTADKLDKDAKVVIFPEEYEEHNNIVHHFQRGFIHTAKFYYRHCGKALPFVPMYVCPALGCIVIGKPIVYDPENKTEEEAERICTYLEDAVSELAYELPRHRVTPYPNVSKREYPYNDR